MENDMILLTNLVYGIFAFACFVAIFSAISIFNDVIRTCLSTQTKAATPETMARDVWLARLEQESYIMSLKVVTENVSNEANWFTTQEKINATADSLKKRILERRSNYELLNRNVAQ